MIQENIRQALNKAAKEKDETALSVLRMLTSALQEKEKKKRYRLSIDGLSGNELEEAARLSEEEIMDTVSSEVKKRKESIVAFEKAERKDRALQEKKEMDILSEYLPEQISEDELAEMVKKAIEEVGARDQKDIGKVMSKVMPLVKGKADGSDINRLAREMLS